MNLKEDTNITNRSGKWRRKEKREVRRGERFQNRKSDCGMMKEKRKKSFTVTGRRVEVEIEVEVRFCVLFRHEHTSFLQLIESSEQ